MPVIRKFLDCSTAHVTKNTAERLDHGPIDGIIRNNTTYGWFVYVPSTADDINELGTEYEIPAELLDMLRYARNLGCDYILFDGDADTIDDLPTFDW